MACDQGHLVSTYLDGELQAAEAVRFQAHLADCPYCQEAMSEIRQVDEALRQQSVRRRSRLSDCSESIADSVQRELTRSGEFTRARRSTIFRQAPRQLWVMIIFGLVLATVAVAAIHLFSARRAPAISTTGTRVTQVRQLQQPYLASVMAEAGTMLSQLQRDAATPGAARRIRDEAAASGIREHLLIAEANSIAQHDPTVAALRIALTQLLNLPDSDIERRARQLAWALRESRLVMRLTAATADNGGAGLGGLRSDDALVAQLSGNHERAMELFEQRMTMTRDEATRTEALFGLGQSQLAGGHYTAAAATLLGFVEKHPTHSLADDALLAAADAHRKSGDALRCDELYGKLRMEYGNSRLALVALLHQGKLAEEQGEFAIALRLYDLAQAPPVRCAILADEAEARRRFIVENRDADFIALRNYRQADVKSRNPQHWTDAFVTLVRLANSYRQQPIGDDALLLLTRLHIAQNDMNAAEQSFRRLLEFPPATLARGDVREVALPAVGWLLADAAAAIAGGRRVFAELSGYSAAEALRSPRETAHSWQLNFASSTAGGSNARQLRLNVAYSRAKPGQKCDYENLGLVRSVTIETPNPLLREEIERILRQVDDALTVLDRSADDRHVPDWPTPR